MHYQRKLDDKQSSSALYRNEDQYGDPKVIKQSDAVLQGLVIVRGALNPKIRRLILKSYCICLVSFEKGKLVKEWPLTDIVSVTYLGNRKCFQITFLEHKTKRNKQHTKKISKAFETRSSSDADIWVNGIKKACGVAYHAVPGLELPSVGSTDAWQPANNTDDQISEPGPLHRSRSMSDPATPTTPRRKVRLDEKDYKEDTGSDLTSEDDDDDDDDDDDASPMSRQRAGTADTQTRKELFPNRTSASVPNLPLIPELSSVTMNAPAPSSHSSPQIAAAAGSRQSLLSQASPVDFINWFDSPRKSDSPAAVQFQSPSPSATWARASPGSNPASTSMPAIKTPAVSSGTHNLLSVESPSNTPNSRRRSRSVGVTAATSLSADIYSPDSRSDVPTTNGTSPASSSASSASCSSVLVFVSTGPAPTGKSKKDPKAVDYLGLVSATVTVPLPTQASLCSQAIETARASAQKDLETKARQQGANALIGIGYTSSVHQLGVSVMAFGTACGFRFN